VTCTRVTLATSEGEEGRASKEGLLPEKFKRKMVRTVEEGAEENEKEKFLEESVETSFTVLLLDTQKGKKNHFCICLSLYQSQLGVWGFIMGTPDSFLSLIPERTTLAVSWVRKAFLLPSTSHPHVQPRNKCFPVSQDGDVKTETVEK
jgi:hypothetical protein